MRKSYKQWICFVLALALAVSMLTGCGIGSVPEAAYPSQDPWGALIQKALYKTGDLLDIMEYLLYGESNYTDKELQDKAKGFRELEDEFNSMVDDAVSQFSDRLDSIAGYMD